MAREAIKNCIDCRRAFISKHPNQVRCPECQRTHTKAMQDKWKKAKRTEPKKAPDPNECKKKEKCIYGGTAGGIKICDYYSITGKRRGCPVKGCTKYERKQKRKKPGGGQ